MRRKYVERWAIAGVVGTLLLGAEPPVWGTVPAYAASNTAMATTSRGIQSILAKGLEAHNTSINLKYQGSTKNLKTLLQQAVNDALEDDPYTQYIVDRYEYSWRGTPGYAQITLQVNYRETAEQTAYVNQRVAAILKALIKPGMNAHQKIKLIHNYVVQNLKYDTKLQKYTAYEGLHTGEAVCQGYALLTYKLLKGAGVENQIVEGTAGGQAHVWNLVSLDGRWYHLDTTWDDPMPDQQGRINYDYYLLTDEQMRKDHNWIAGQHPGSVLAYRTTLQSLIQEGGPDADVYANLERQLGYDLYAADAAVENTKGLTDKVKKVLAEGKSTVTVRYSGAERQLIKDLGNLYDLDIENIRYLAEPLDGTPDLRVEIYWER